MLSNKQINTKIMLTRNKIIRLGLGISERDIDIMVTTLVEAD